MDMLLEILNQLIGCDSQNPPRQIDVNHRLFNVVDRFLPGQFQTDIVDHGNGRVSYFAVRGRPKMLFNVHLDTVPAGEGWSVDPFSLTVSGKKCLGRGSCDIKGAAACLLTVAQSSDADMAVLFTTDEEGSESCCVDAFCQSEACRPFEQVVVAEPTECQAVTAHRGYLSVTATFTGNAGHTSETELLSQSANHRGIQWTARALRQIDDFETKELGQSCCFNIGRIHGGIKNNMIADRCQISFSARPPSGVANESILEILADAAPLPSEQLTTFAGPSLPTDPSHKIRAEAFCRSAGLAIGEPVDFWTEAAIFSRHGIPAMVLGPGNIAQAHTADEWVSLDQLNRCRHIYQSLLLNNESNPLKEP